ncbi:decapping nuclease DXO homolog [Anopheles darlingi]|uniref:decapping nuclease DXO homolog n=1 Tax=Anopheles darlingi TaxID=43151 RepID=UPI0021000233|nr:decapping nuclease DXO homolog [Anopheles darlingi]
MFSSTSLDPVPAKRQSKPFPSISQPKLVGFFSIDAHRKYDGSAAQLKYLSLPPPPRTDLHLDLNEGFEIHHPKPESAKAEGIDMLLSYLRHNSTPDSWTHRPESELSGESRTARLRYDFVCFRGLLRLIACTPYDRNTGWIVQAIRYRGTIYLCERPTAEKLESARNETEQQRRFCFYGFKFEQHILTERPNIRPDTSEPVVLSEEFCSLFDSTLAGKRLLYGAEMDGIILEEKRPPLDRDGLTVDELRRFEFVEVKVKRRETNQRQLDNFYRFKTKNWWCQSFLVNVQRIVVGLRDDRGIVREITEMKLKDLQRDSRHHWSAAVCINFLDEFLQEVATVLKGVDDCTRVFQFEYSPQEHARVRYRDLGVGHPDSFLPQWYTQYVESK